MGPRFSVIVPTRDRAAVLPHALQSVLHQTCADFEIVVVDDGSNDGTAAVVASFDDPRVRYVRRDGEGVSAARNAGAAAARGSALVFLDDDDELVPDALATFAAAADRHGWDVVHAGWITVSPNGREWTTRLPGRPGMPEHRRGSFLAGTAAINAAVFAAVAGYDTGLRYGENTVLGWRVREHLDATGGRMGVVEQPVVILRTRASRGHDRKKYESAKRILGVHGATLDSDVAGPRRSRERRSSLLAVAGVEAARLGRRSEALRYAGAAIAADPFAAKRYRNLVHVLRLLVRRAPRSAPADHDGAVAVAPSARDAASAGGVHAVLVTFDRPASLGRMLEQLASAGLASVTVVDNAPSPVSEQTVRGAPVSVDYVPMPSNTGPAGGFAAGMEHVLTVAGDDDWVLFLDDDRLTAPPPTITRLCDFGAWMLSRGAPVGAVGQVGSRFDRRTGRLERLRDEELVAGPLTVDYIASGQLLTVRVGAAREVGVMDADLFFAFEDLDYCLRLARRGYGLYIDGLIAREARERFGRLGVNEKVERRSTPWRRYYSVRSSIVVMRRASTLPRALVFTLVHLVVRPVVDLVKRRPEWAATTLAGWRGGVDAWTGRLGRRMEPAASAAASDE